MRLKEIKPGMVIHCKTEEELKTLLDELTVLGYVWWSDGTPPKRMSYFAPILINTYEDSGVGKNITYSMVGEKKNYTEFSDLIIPELSAKEVLETLHDMCSFYNSEGRQCDDCPADPYCVSMSFKDGMDSFLDACTKWREEHTKEEKKELETEWVYVVRIIQVHDNGKKECVHEVVCNIEFSDMDKVAEAEFKHYCSEHKGNFFATLEHICRIKE